MATKNFKSGEDKRKHRLEVKRQWSRNNRDKQKKSWENWKAKYPDRFREGSLRASRKHNLGKKYGITLEDYAALLTKQEGKCALCHQPSETTLVVDHDHETGAIRGLIHRQCNIGIGIFNDDIVLLEQAIKYLKQYGNEKF